MGISIRKQGFTDAVAVTLDIVDTMLANGFKAIYPVTDQPPYDYVRPTDTQKFYIVLEAGGTVDPLNAEEVPQKQPWRIAFHCSDNATMGIFLGTDVSLPSDSHPPYVLAPVKITNSSQSETTIKIVGARGIVGDEYKAPSKRNGPTVQHDMLWFEDDGSDFQPHWSEKTQGFINRKIRTWLGVRTAQTSGSTPIIEPIPTYPGAEKDMSATFPLSYYLAISDRGIFLNVWEGSTADLAGEYFSWLLVQRPVDRDTGATIVAGKAPVFAVFSVGGKIQRMVVREIDRVDVSVKALADSDTPDFAAIINSKRQVGVSEDNQYVVSFPSRLNTPRYAYTYELDMVGFTSATVVSGNTDVPLTLYDELEARNYLGMHANLPNGNGMRLVALQMGGGIDQTNVETNV